MNGGGMGEMEETMMWYAVSHEKAEEEDWTWTTPSTCGIAKETQAVCSSTASCPCSHLGSPSESLHGQIAAVAVSCQLWLVKQVAPYNGRTRRMQIFRQDVIEPQYKAVLPNQCVTSPVTERSIYLETADRPASYLAFPVTFHGLRPQ